MSTIGVHGEGECVYIGDIGILKGELELGVRAEVVGLAAVGCIVGLGGAVSLCRCFVFSF